MPGPFDNAAKRLLREKPQHIVSWLVAGGIFLHKLIIKLFTMQTAEEAKQALMGITAES